MLFASKHSLAISFEPIQLQSNPSELFYAEIKYRNVEPRTVLEVSLANAEDLSSLRLPDQNHPHFNIYIRKTGDGRQGIIVLTALQPIPHSQLNLLLKIKVDNVIHFQQVNCDLNQLRSTSSTSINEQVFLPQSIAHESEIALDLPNTTSRQSQLSTASFEPLYPANAAAMTALISSEPLEQPSSENEPENQPIEPFSTKALNPNINLNTTADPDDGLEDIPQSYLVRGSQSLSKIAEQIARSTHQKTSTVMQELKRNNKHAFIQGDPDRLRKGATLHFFLPEKPMHSITQPSTEQLRSTTEIP